MSRAANAAGPHYDPKGTNAGYRINPNAELHLKAPEEMLRLFRDYPNAIRRSLDIADSCRFALDELRYEYPSSSRSKGARRRGA